METDLILCQYRMRDNFFNPGTISVSQGFSFAFPVTLAVPLTVTLLITACGLRNEDACFFRDSVPDYLYFECPSGGDFFGEFISNQHAWIWVVWLLSQVW